MLTTDNVRRTAMGACASCGTYRADCPATCPRGKEYTRGPSRYANPDDPFSPAFEERRQILQLQRMMGDIDEIEL